MQHTISCFSRRPLLGCERLHLDSCNGCCVSVGAGTAVVPVGTFGIFVTGWWFQT